MTKKDAIDIIKSECYVFNPLNFDRSTMVNTALDIAIKLLEQEPCEDCISREELDKALYEHFHEEDSPNNITDVRLGAVRNFIRNFPSINPQEPKLDTLDKIKAEIEEEYGYCNICEYFEDYDYEDNDISEYRYVASVKDILQIIDKYKAESEDD